MNRTLSLLLITFLMLTAACVGNTNIEQADINQSEANAEIEEPQKELIDLSEISQIIQGVWLPREYVQDLYETHSAYAASRSIPDVAELQIDPKKIKNDTLYVGSSLNNHEGYGFTIWFEKSNGKVIIKSNARDWEADKYSVELSYKTSPDTLLTLVTKDTNGKVIRQDDYLRIRTADHISKFGGMGYEYFARKVLLNGAYQLYDSAGTSLGAVNFNAESGAVKGFKYKYYDIQTDFGGGPSYEGDFISLLPTKGDYRNSAGFVLKVESDTIAFYTTEESADETDYSIILKDRQYYLIRNKQSITTE